MKKYFNYNSKNIFTCEDVEIPKIIKKLDTPLYIYSKQTILNNYNQLNEAFQKINPIICFAIKSNFNLSILKLLKDAGAGADIVSGGELNRALDVGFNPKKIVYAGIGKTNEEIVSAILADILMFNTESLDEIIIINTIARSLHKKACIAIRINPDINPKTHPYISTGLINSKFGINIKNTKQIIKEILKLQNITLIGIHMHIGSQITKISPFYDSIKKLVELIKDLNKDGIAIKYLNLGGGLGIRYNDEIPPTPSEYLKSIEPLLKEVNCKIILEPGRYIIGDAGILVTKVLYNKTNDSKKFVIVDAGMNDLIRPSLYDAFHSIMPIEKKLNAKKVKVDIVGPICESADFFAKDRLIPQIDNGEFLAIECCGAYGSSMSSNYNSRPKLAEVLVDKNIFETIRHRETFADLIQKEKINAIQFSKISGIGNDCILIDNRKNIIKENLSSFAKNICKQKNGVNADAIVLLENSTYSDFTIRIFNKDGSESEIYDNAACCSAIFAFEKKLISSRDITFETKKGIEIVKIDLKNNTNVKVKIKNPTELKLEFKISGTRMELNFIDTGVPNAVVFVDDLEKLDIIKTGNFIRFHNAFSPHGTNVNFVKIIDKNKIIVRTYEQGIENETIGNITGAIASALIYAINSKVKSPVEVITSEQNKLNVYFSSSINSFNEVYLEGKIVTAFDGYYYL